jgi:hypothetical protein
MIDGPQAALAKFRKVSLAELKCGGTWDRHLVPENRQRLDYATAQCHVRVGPPPTV